MERDLQEIQSVRDFFSMPEEHLAKWILVPDDPELLKQAKNDPIKFMRDTVSLPTVASKPYFSNMEVVYAAIASGLINPFMDQTESLDSSWGNKREDFAPRFIHVDLAQKHDAACFAMGHVKSYVEVAESGRVVRKPIISIDCIARFTKLTRGEIKQEYILDQIKLLYNKGFDIKLITFDKYNSVKPIQDLRDEGFTCDVLSVDHTTYVPILDAKQENGVKHESTKGDVSCCYHMLKQALDERRLEMFYHKNFLEEIQLVEEDPRSGKVFTPTKLPDDTVQPVAAIVTLITKNEQYVSYNMETDDFEITENQYSGQNPEDSDFYSGLDDYYGLGNNSDSNRR